MEAPRRRGRPATGHDPTVTVRLPVLLIQQIDDWADERGVTRSDAIRAALEALVRLGGLEPEPEPAKARQPKRPAPALSVRVSVPVGRETLKPGALLKKR